MDTLKTQGIALPRLGFGTYRLEGDAGRAAVESALALGYRHIDTATIYGNEAQVGQALAASGLPRGELHVTTKLWHTDMASGAAIRAALDASLQRLRLDHVDLYLVHWPVAGMDLGLVVETLLRLRGEGRTRAIGVCNFGVPLLKRAVEEIGAPIACNQVEYHVLLDQSPLRRYQARHGIPLVAYCPLAQGTLADHAALRAIADRHGATPAQVALKWLLDQPGVAAIPKAQRAASQQANLDALTLRLDDADRTAIAALPKDRRFVSPAFAPRWDTG